MKLRIIGQRNILGAGVHYGNFCDALKRVYFINRCLEEVDIADQAEMNRAASNSTDDDVNICFVPFETNKLFRGFNVHWAIFESTLLPQEMVKTLNTDCDLVWVPSSWGKEILVKNGIPAHKIDVVPEGVNSNDYHPFLRASLEKGKTFRFLTVGKFEKRKSYEELLQAFKQAFGDCLEVSLVIKADFFLNAASKKQELISLVDSLALKNVEMHWGSWNQNLMVDLYNYCDVFLFPTKAEGWGLPLIEAAASGMPLITTYHSGHTEFLKDISDSCIFVDFSLERIDDPEYSRYCPPSMGEYGKWAVPDLSSLKNSLILAKSSYSKFKKQAIESSRHIRTKFSWENAATIALSSLASRNRIRTSYRVN